MAKLIDSDSHDNSDAPKWMVLHRPVGDPQRRRWGPDIARIADDLIRYGWVMWREGSDAHLKHRSMMAN